MTLRIISFGVIAWAISKIIELGFSFTIGTALSNYLAHLLYVFFEICIFILFARLLAPYILNYFRAYWRIISLGAGFIWAGLSIIGDIFLWLIIYDMSFYEFIDPYLIWKGNLKLLLVAIQIAAPKYMAGRLRN